MTLVFYKVSDENNKDVESDETNVADVKAWAADRRAICASKGWTISIWDNEGNNY